MLIIGLLVSLGITALFCGVTHDRKAAAAQLVTFNAVGFVVFMLTIYGLPFVLQLLGLDLVFILWIRKGWRYSTLVALALVVAPGAWAVYAIYLFVPGGRYDRLRREYPLVSLENRLGRHGPLKPILPLTQASQTALTDLEQGLQREWYPTRDRTRALELLHQDTMDLFVRMPGFGVGRFKFSPEEPIEFGIPYWRGAVPQPDAAASIEDSSLHRDSAGEPFPEPGLEPLIGMSDLHAEAIRMFVDPRGFGYVRDRAQVAGFIPHHLGDLPTPDSRKITLQSLELVSLLLHDPPAVYVSPNLPAMDELHDKPTRPLDSFERQGLQALLAGEPVHVATRPGQIRMLGAVRATKQCIKCHGGERGDLLGAFSYRLSQ